MIWVYFNFSLMRCLHFSQLLPCFPLSATLALPGVITVVYSEAGCHGFATKRRNLVGGTESQGQDRTCEYSSNNKI